MKKNWTIFNGLLAVLISLMLMTGCSDDDHSTAGVESGKVIQGPVKGATVFLDINGDRKWNQGEPSVKTKDDGSYTLNIPKGKEGLICTSGGQYERNGGWVDALPLLAPRGAKNITSLTTLAALNPQVRLVLGCDYDKNPYEEKMSSAALRLKIVAENYMKSFRDDLGKTDPKDILSGMILLAGKIGELLKSVDALEVDSKIIQSVDEAIFEALKSSLVPDKDERDKLSPKELEELSKKIEKVKSHEDLAKSDPVLGSVYNNITENLAYTVKAIDVEKTYDSDEIAGLEEKAEVLKIGFNPTTNFIPMPNDLAWAAYGEKVNLPIDPKGDPAQKALYTAINKLEISGLSPNTPISVPLSSNKALDLSDAEKKIKIVNLTKLLGGQTPPADCLVGDFTISQDENFLKIYPTTPLDPGTKYGVALAYSIKTSDNEVVKKNSLFELLKTDPAEVPSLGNASLDAIRDNYSQLFTGLEAFGLPAENVLNVFTFTTAEKTLSTTDFRTVQETISAGGNPSDMTVKGLDYARVPSEYGSVNMFVGVKLLGKTAQELKALFAAMGMQEAISSDITAMTSDQDYFESLDITSITPFLMGGEPQYIDVPYVIYNQDKFGNNRQVIVFQHGFGGDKAHAQVIAQKFPDYTVIAMDLPYHGDRTPEGKTSGSEYLTTNLPQNRMNLYQSFYDMSVLIQGLKAGKFDIDGDGTPDTPSTIHFAGQSLGAITGSVAAKYNQASLGKVVLNVGGANFASILDTATNALLTGLVKSLGIEKNSPQYFVTLGVLQLIMDPCDPAYLAKDLTTNVEDTIFQFAYKDTLVSNVSNQILGNVAGANNLYFADFSNTNPATGDEDETPKTLFESGNAYLFGGVAGKTDNWIPHGFLLDPRVTVDGELKYPEAEGFMDEDYATEAHSAVVTWTTDYLN